jgi:hypothetical protein
MLLYRRLASVSPVPDKVTQMEVLPAALAENKGECYWTDRTCRNLVLVFKEWYDVVMYLSVKSLKIL